MANRRRFSLNDERPENGRPFNGWVIRELKAQREDLKAQQEPHHRALGLIGAIAKDLDKVTRSVNELARFTHRLAATTSLRFDRVDRRLDRLDAGVTEILRRLPPRS